MKAIVQDTYGSADVLELRDIDTPVAGDTQVLVRIHAASINASDWYMMAGLPYLVRLGFGVPTPKIKVRGHDLAEEVVAVGSQVTRFQPGDLVFGATNGAFGEYACAPEDKLTAKPASVTFAQAAAVPVAALTALQGLRDHGNLQSGQRVLVIGASGGVGSFAVQIAKALGAEVTGVCSTTNVELVSSIGADRVIDYMREDFTDTDRRYDLLLDIRGTRPLSKCLRLLDPGGNYVLAGGPRGRWIGPLAAVFKLLVSKPFVGPRLRNFVANINREDLSTLSDLMTSGKVTPAIDRTYPLGEVPDAIRYWETGHVRGKVVIDCS
jgi:NADPH:quinone reductase-like Zn-dependent oxidoreductase